MSAETRSKVHRIWWWRFCPHRPCTTTGSAKKGLDSTAAIPEYWVVDPEAHVVDQFVLRNGAYELLGRHAETVTVQVIDDVRVDLREVW